ncbi:GBG2 protein, partial [Anhinga rufa]|nr:GBG2 protein [Anhinga rufa]
LGCCQPSPTGRVSQDGMTPGQPDPNAGLLLFQVSKAAADLMAYCEAHAKEDPLLTPVPASENPFREKKFFCVIL